MTGSFYVRNGGSTPGTLRLQASAVDDDLVRTFVVGLALRGREVRRG